MLDWIREKGPLLFGGVWSIKSITFLLLYQSGVSWCCWITLSFYCQRGWNLVRTATIVLETHRVAIVVVVLDWARLLDYRLLLRVAAHLLCRRIEQLSESNILNHLLHLIRLLVSSCVCNSPQRCWSVGRNFQGRLVWAHLGWISLIELLFVVVCDQFD